MTIFGRRTSWLLLWLSLLLTGLVSGLYAYAQNRGMDEYRIKAAFLYNFANFIQWPGESFPDAGPPISVCVLGDNPFGSALEHLKSKTVKGRKVMVKYTRTIEGVSGCNILFVSSSEAERLRHVLKAVQGLNVLTVGDTEGFAQSGVIINLYTDQDRVRFEVNPEAASRAGLKISSELLKLARIIE